MQSTDAQSHGIRCLFKHLGLILVFLLSLVIPPQASSQYQSRESIRSAAHDFMLNLAQREHDTDTEVKVGQLDPRLRLASCEQPLHSFLPPGGRSLGNTTVGVRCPGIKPWTLYVSVLIKVYREILINTRPLIRGEVIRAQDLKLESHNLSTLISGYMTDPALVVGKITKRSLPTGTPITASVLTPPRLINRGGQVTLLIESSGIQVRATAEAMADGAYGDTIRVRNTASRQVVEGIVVSSGIVRVSR